MQRAFLLTLAFYGCLPIAASSDTGKSYYCQIEETTVTAGKKEQKIDKFWMTGATQFRMEDPHSGFSLIHIVNNTDAWLLETSGKTGYHSRKPSPNFALEASYGPQGWVHKGDKKIGQGRVDGLLCDIYQRTEKGGSHTTLWVLPGQERLPKRMRVAGTLSIGPQRIKFNTVLNFKKWQVKHALDKGLFSPPSEYRIQDVPAKGSVRYH
jgi:hypothetical protein